MTPFCTYSLLLIWFTWISIIISNQNKNIFFYSPALLCSLEISSLSSWSWLKKMLAISMWMPRVISGSIYRCRDNSEHNLCFHSIKILPDIIFWRIIGSKCVAIIEINMKCYRKNIWKHHEIIWKENLLFESQFEKKIRSFDNWMKAFILKHDD